MTPSTIWAIGNFDGVHPGHQAVIRKAQQQAAHSQHACGVLTFEPHPRSYFAPNAPAFRLTTAEDKYQLIRALGIEQVISLPFDAYLANLSPEGFVKHILQEQLCASGVVVGYDFLFGQQRRGNTKTLEHLGMHYGITVDIVDAVYDHGQHLYSSSAIRHALRAGDVATATAGLGRPWQVRALVSQGYQRGRTIGFPTANLDIANYVAPKRGVYAVRVQTPDGCWHDAVANYGIKPTVRGDKPLLEVHIFHFTGDLYGQHLSVQFHQFLREEQTFAHLDALKKQIAADSQIAQNYLAALSLPPS